MGFSGGGELKVGLRYQGKKYGGNGEVERKQEEEEEEEEREREQLAGWWSEDLDMSAWDVEARRTLPEDSVLGNLIVFGELEGNDDEDEASLGDLRYFSE
jgi:hypothetical protein